MTRQNDFTLPVSVFYCFSILLYAILADCGVSCQVMSISLSYLPSLESPYPPPSRARIVNRQSRVTIEERPISDLGHQPFQFNVPVRFRFPVTQLFFGLATFTGLGLYSETSHDTVSTCRHQEPRSVRFQTRMLGRAEPDGRVSRAWTSRFPLDDARHGRFGGG